MGKYTKKGKTTGNVISSTGVRTRSQTLAVTNTATTTRFPRLSKTVSSVRVETDSGDKILESSHSTESIREDQNACNTESGIPTSEEMEEFFAAFELRQQELFLQRYNYDIVNDAPHSGRYEWVRLD